MISNLPLKNVFTSQRDILISIFSLDFWVKHVVTFKNKYSNWRKCRLFLKSLRETSHNTPEKPGIWVIILKCLGEKKKKKEES